MFDFGNKVAVVTGGASGIGRSTALSLARRGVNIVLADLNDQRGGDTRREIQATGAGCLFQRCDVTSDADVEALRAAAIAEYGGVDILMNNAGVLPVGTIENTPLAAWRQCFEVNLFAYVQMTQAFLPTLRSRGGAHIVNTASFAGLFGVDPNSPAYNASKAAVVNFSETLAVTLGGTGIGVTCLCPGPVSTNIAEQISLHGEIAGLGQYCMAKVQSRTADEVGEMVVEAISARRFLLHTDQAVDDILQRRARNPEGFIDEVVRCAG